MTPEQNFRDVEVDHPVHIISGDQRFEVNTDPNRADYQTTEGVLVWLERKKIRTRYLDAEGNQVGPWHDNLFPALIWAAAQGWRDPSAPDWWNDGLIAEVRAGGAPLQKGQRA